MSLKLAAILVPIALALFPSSTDAVQLQYDTIYDNSNGDLNTVACSDGPNGMLTAGYSTFGSLPKFPFIGAAEAVQGWNSAACGTCWELTYTTKSAKRAINVLAIDHASLGLNIAKKAMDQLTGNQAQELGKIDVQARQVPSSVCGLN
uniref:Cerato-platanin 1 n=1 Tax=Crinipellis campanella TaxID=34447 RepID=S4UQY5_9AGAR|nr:cerato-platanin 1 [Crinipellis campanella]